MTSLIILGLVIAVSVYCSVELEKRGYLVWAAGFMGAVIAEVLCWIVWGAHMLVIKGWQP